MYIKYNDDQIGIYLMDGRWNWNRIQIKHAIEICCIVYFIIISSVLNFGFLLFLKCNSMPS